MNYPVKDPQEFRFQIQKILALRFSRENVLAVILALVLIAIYIMTASDSPIWIYQGF